MTFSFLKQQYGRKSGKIEVCKFVRISNKGEIAYVERRHHPGTGSTFYKTGAIIGSTIVLTHVSASDAHEYNVNLKAALESHGINI